MIQILGTVIGQVEPKTIWQNSMNKLRNETKLITIPFQTWQAKTLLAKSKLYRKLLILLTHTHPTSPSSDQ